MLHRFATYEHAALFVAMKRDQGYFAQIMHEHVSVLWGPLAMSGVAAWVSEYAAEDGEEVPDLDFRVPSLPLELSKVVGYCALAVMGSLLALVLFFLVREAFYYPYEVGKFLLVFALCASAIATIGIGLGILLSGWLHMFWDAQHRYHMAAAGIHVILGAVMLINITPVGSVMLLLWDFLSGGY
jgi:hypothetical protein